jgi:hypothetical protein
VVRLIGRAIGPAGGPMAGPAKRMSLPCGISLPFRYVQRTWARRRLPDHSGQTWHIQVFHGSGRLGLVAAIRSAPRGAAVNVAEYKIVPHGSVVSAELDDERILLHVETGVYFGLDALGNRIWELILAGTDYTGILETLLDEYDVERARLDADLSSFLGLLAEKGLIDTSGTAG